MPQPFGARLKHAWNAFQNRDPTGYYDYNLGPGNSRRPDRSRLRIGNERSIISSIYNRIALDVASLPIQHVRLNEDDRFLNVINSSLNDCLTVEANIDQSGAAFRHDLVLSMLDEGCVAAAPIDTDVDPMDGTYQILSLRTAKIEQWYPKDVKLNVYNDRNGLTEPLIMSKKEVCIIENPLYVVMNEPNSTLRRLIRKLNLLDSIDEQSGSGKLDLIIQLPYVIKSAARREEAEKRRKMIEDQLSGTKYGIAYTDGTEHITQLNRSVENNLMAQIEYLTSMLYSQLGLTQSVFDGTADDKVLANYYCRTIQPILSVIIGEMNRKFLTKTARTQRQAIRYFRDPLGLVPVSQLAELVDKLSRNEILSPNEVRDRIGVKASDDPKADELRNRNVAEAKTGGGSTGNSPTPEEGQNGG